MTDLFLNDLCLVRVLFSFVRLCALSVHFTLNVSEGEGSCSGRGATAAERVGAALLPEQQLGAPAL